MRSPRSPDNGHLYVVRFFDDSRSKMRKPRSRSNIRFPAAQDGADPTVVVFALPARPSMEASHSGVVRISCAHLDLIGGQSSVCCPLANLFGSRDGRFWPHPACIRLRLSRSRATISGVVKVPLGEEMEASRAISARRCPKRCSRDAACPDRSLRSHAGGPSLRARGVNHRLALGAVGHGEAKSLLNTCPAGTRTAWVRGWRSKRIPYSCARE